MSAQKNEEYEPIGDLVRLFKRGRTWYANFQLNGKQHRKSLKTTSKKEARRQALLLEAELLQGQYQPQAKPPSVAEVVTDYMKYVRTEGRAAKTITKYEHVLGLVKELAEELRRSSILDLDLSFVDEYRHRRVQAQRSPKTIYNETMILRQLVNFAVTRKLITSDPLAGLKVKEPKPTPQPCWSRDEMDQILAASPEPQRWVFAILADTGMRIGELEHLTWNDVDFERNLLHVRPKPGWKPKTGDQRSIPLSTTLKRLLAQLPRNCEWVLTAPPSAQYPRGDHQISERRLLKCLKRVLKPLGLEGHLHTFRHAFISHALTSGIPEAVVRSWVGHVDRDVIKLYTHIADTESQSAMRRLNQNQSDSSSSDPEGETE